METTKDEVPKFGPATQKAGRAIKVARENAKMSLRELSDRLERRSYSLSASALQRMEIATRRIDLDDLEALSAVLEVDQWTLTNGGEGFPNDIGDNPEGAMWEWLECRRLMRLEAHYAAAARASRDDAEALSAARASRNLKFDFTNGND